MLKFLDWVMNPIFSDSFVSHFAWMGDWGLLVLVLLKMAIMFAGSLVLALPLLPFVIKLYRHLMKEIEAANFEEEKETEMPPNVIKFPEKKIKVKKKIAP